MSVPNHCVLSFAWPNQDNDPWNGSNCEVRYADRLLVNSVDLQPDPGFGNYEVNGPRKNWRSLNGNTNLILQRCHLSYYPGASAGSHAIEPMKYWTPPPTCNGTLCASGYEPATDFLSLPQNGPQGDHINKVMTYFSSNLSFADGIIFDEILLDNPIEKMYGPFWVYPSK